jgi:multiple sugar transport system ATP-binding protein
VNLFVGGFIGSPAMNLIEAQLERDGDAIVVTAGAMRIHLDEETTAARPDLEAHVGRDVILGIRPEDVEDVALAGDVPAERRLRGVVELREALGSEILVHLRVDAPPARADAIRELAEDRGDERAIAGEGDDEQHALVVARFGARSRVKEGEPVEAAVDTRSLHFFDPENGLGIYGVEQTKGVPA